ncbi:hypothetical protein BD408DRAFT_242169 [Parasitella parasitica]|nr:hypothetical protein BD408DRAFT_242169 [Parasitella parasitica]
MSASSYNISGSSNGNTNNNEAAFRPQTPILRKSQSAISLPQYCRQVTPFSNTDDPSPTDLVEQLFKPKPATNSKLAIQVGSGNGGSSPSSSPR